MLLLQRKVKLNAPRRTWTCSRSVRCNLPGLTYTVNYRSGFPLRCLACLTLRGRTLRVCLYLARVQVHSVQRTGRCHSRSPRTGSLYIQPQTPVCLISAQTMYLFEFFRPVQRWPSYTQARYDQPCLILKRPQSTSISIVEVVVVVFFVVVFSLGLHVLQMHRGGCLV